MIIINATFRYVLPTRVVIGAGLESRGTSCKRHEMSSIKNGCGEGWVERGHTYLKRERLGLGLGLGLGLIEPLVTRVG